MGNYVAKKRNYTLKYGTLRTLQEYADEYGLEVRREGLNRGFKLYRADGEWLKVTDFSNNTIPQGIRDRSFEEWAQIIKDNALLLLAEK
ncbi:modulator protein [Salmonella enterica]|nr:modulator protein [Salmonella enterica]EHK5999327.1 modulator protein [Salmonella enterica]EIF5124546.1 modulator protein [Salmonella enterica]EIF5348722.1 modulator protein [Salmonella enterica]EIF5657319.1 modulator protein [Salmonella enterica]